MKIVEMTTDEISGFNKRAIEHRNKRISASSECHNLIRRGDLESALGSIFFQSIPGYINLPVEKMAGLLLYRISQRQAFENGNKRTAVLACVFFLQNHGLKLHINNDEIMSLIHGFATGVDGSAPIKNEDDAIQYIFANIEVI